MGRGAGEILIFVYLKFKRSSEIALVRFQTTFLIGTPGFVF
ncbi:hypothetical protein NEISICOT_00805 [Neisseria sicca ATCC 29256]|uniref:Uncharacterized protein n=1 Tax=Neisseria sicca ATCC 29256 TaxID=547045 RepID=C6M2R6_NEISI|nr:hypothetical protein NEISICOT_00805 [Neisseria sicca ATCC 29256]